MKTNFFVMVATASMILASCIKDHEMSTPSQSDEARVTITLAGADTETRVFFDSTAAAETWEKSISTLSVVAFDSGGSLIIRRDFTASELSARSATFSLPKSAAGTSCLFYAVANFDASSVRTKAALLALVENAAASNNGTFAEVSTKAKRPGGFVMSGSVTKTIGAVNSTTNVGITIKRTVAKVALQMSVDPVFAQNIAGRLRSTPSSSPKRHLSLRWPRGQHRHRE